MALVCVNGAKECDGCGRCSRVGDVDGAERCEYCGGETADGERYHNALYSVLCLECLKELYSL